MRVAINLFIIIIITIIVIIMATRSATSTAHPFRRTRTPRTRPAAPQPDDQAHDPASLTRVTF